MIATEKSHGIEKEDQIYLLMFWPRRDEIRRWPVPAEGFGVVRVF